MVGCEILVVGPFFPFWIIFYVVRKCRERDDSETPVLWPPML